MANTYNWIIVQLECYPEHNNHTDVVFTVHWRRQATDAPFTAYADLTEAQGIGWLEDAFGTEALAAQISALDKQIVDQINPPIVRPELPWLAALEAN